LIGVRGYWWSLSFTVVRGRPPPRLRRSVRCQTWSDRGRNLFLRAVLCRSVVSRIRASRSVSSSPQFPTWTAKIAVTFLHHAWHTALLHGEPLGTTQGVRLGPGSAVAIGRRRHFRCPRRRAPSRARRRGRSSRGRQRLGAGTGRASGARGPVFALRDRPPAPRTTALPGNEGPRRPGGVRRAGGGRRSQVS
jgi:hypothetical protein